MFTRKEKVNLFLLGIVLVLTALTESACGPVDDPNPEPDTGNGDKDAGTTDDTGNPDQDAQTGNDAGKDDGGGQLADCSGLDSSEGMWYAQDHTTCDTLGGPMEVNIKAVAKTCEITFDGKCSVIGATFHGTSLPIEDEVTVTSGTLKIKMRIEAEKLLIDIIDNGTFMGTLTYGRTAP